MTEETDVKELGSETQPVNEKAGGVNNEPSAPADFVIPDEYKEAGWANNIHSVNDLWQQHANAQKLIGKKTIGIPTADSSEDEISEFYSKVRPETEDGYDFDLGEDTKTFKDIFYKNGVSARQAKEIVKGYMESVRKASEGLYSEAGFDKIMKETLGDDYKQKIDKVNGFLKQYGKKSALAEIDNLPNETLGLVYGLINLTMDKYAVKELGSVQQKSAINNTGDMVEYMKEMQKLDNDPFATQEKRDEIRRKYGYLK